MWSERNCEFKPNVYVIDFFKIRQSALLNILLFYYVFIFYLCKSVFKEYFFLCLFFSIFIRCDLKFVKVNNYEIKIKFSYGMSLNIKIGVMLQFLRITLKFGCITRLNNKNKRIKWTKLRITIFNFWKSFSIIAHNIMWI